MGMFDHVTLDHKVLDKAREQYRGKSEIAAIGWQTKSLDRQMRVATLYLNSVEYDGRMMDDFTGEVAFYTPKGKPRTDSWEWIEFVALYDDGILTALRHVPESK